MLNSNEFWLLNWGGEQKDKNRPKSNNIVLLGIMPTDWDTIMAVCLI